MLENHALDEVLEDYIFHRLPPKEEAALEEHLLVCETCQERLRRTDEFCQATRLAAQRLRREEEESGPLRNLFNKLDKLRQAPKPVWVSLAAVALLAAVYIPRAGTPPPSQEVALRAVRGAETSAPALAGRRLVLHLDAGELPALSAYRVEVVDAGGSVVWQGSTPGRPETVTARLPEPLKAGRYWVRLSSPDPPGQALREFALDVAP